MSKMSDLEIEIIQMLEAGRSPQYIARVLDVPVNWVYEAIHNHEDEFSPYSTVNS